jgi:hypothetical protein
VREGWSAAKDEAAASSASLVDALPSIPGLRQACVTLGKAVTAAAAPLLQLAVLEAAVSAGRPELALSAHTALKQAAPPDVLDGLFSLLQRDGLFEEATAAAGKPGSGKQLSSAAASAAIVCFEATGAHSGAIKLLAASLLAARGAESATQALPASGTFSADAAASAFAASGLGGDAAVAGVRSVAALRTQGATVPEAVSALLSSLLYSSPLRPTEPPEMALALVQACGASDDARGAVAALLTRARVAAAAGNAATDSSAPFGDALQCLADLLSTKGSEARGSGGGLEKAAGFV